MSKLINKNITRKISKIVEIAIDNQLNFSINANCFSISVTEKDSTEVANCYFFGELSTRKFLHSPSDMINLDSMLKFLQRKYSKK